MTFRPRPLVRLALGLLLMPALAGCYADPEDDLTPHGPAVDQPDDAAPEAALVDPATGIEAGSGEADPATILHSVVQLIRTAYEHPGGANFTIAKDNLNHFFAGSSRKDFQLPDASRAYLIDRFGETGTQRVAALEEPLFTDRDGRHIEDCALLHTVATRVAGDGDDLTRVGRLFDWIIQQIELVPPGALAPPGGNMPQARARPYDVITRGMATEFGNWAERSWIFMALCRQLNLDAALVFYAPPPPPGTPEKDRPEPTVWAVAVLIDGQAHLYDARVGLPIPGPGGRGVATLEQAATDPAILQRLSLGDQPYTLTGPDLAAAGKLTLGLDSTLGMLSPRMRQLQLNLAGRDRMVLFRDPVEQDAAWAAALGDRFGRTVLWMMPVEIEEALFNDPAFNQATRFAGMYFDPALPLLPARLAQLRGETSRAVESFAGFRFSENPVLNDGKTPLDPGVAAILNVYATYLLGLAKLDQGQPDQAAFFFRETLKMLPEPKPGVPYVAYFRYGAETNLGRLEAVKGHRREAIQYLSQPQPTPQRHGNLLLARGLIWPNPFAPEEGKE